MAASSSRLPGEGRLWTADPQVALPVTVDTQGQGPSFQPCTLIDAFKYTVSQRGDAPALRMKRGGSWYEYTFAQYYEQARCFARALAHETTGFKWRDTLCVLAANSPEWAIAAYGSIFAGGIQAGIYATNGVAAVEQVLTHCKAPIVVVDDEDQLAKLATIVKEGRAPALRWVVYTGGGNAPAAGAASGGSEGGAAGSSDGIEANMLRRPLPPAYASLPGFIGWDEFMLRGGTSAPPPRYVADPSVAPPRSAQLDIGQRMPEPAPSPEAVATDPLEAAAAASQPGHCCTLIYTSGTTGTPKAVMLSHDNVIYTAVTGNGYIGATTGDIIVSYLPLSHVAAQLCDLHGGMLTGLCVAFAQPDALKGTLIKTLHEVRPHLFLGVPRVYEKMEERIRAVGAKNTGIKKSIGNWAKAQGTAGSRASLVGESSPVLAFLARSTILEVIHRAIGLQRCRIFATGAAPISLSTLRYFASLGIIIREVFGMSESSGPHTCNTPGPRRTLLGSVGAPLPGLQVKIAGPPSCTEGELLLKGRNVFMGYLGDAAATAATIDAEGWLHSGDVGVLMPFPAEACAMPGPEGPVLPVADATYTAAAALPAGTAVLGNSFTAAPGSVPAPTFLRITGRIKELLITAGGENVAPVPIENAIRAALPDVIANVVVIGDKQRFLSALVTLHVEGGASVDEMPSDTLTPGALAALQAAGLPAGITTASAAAAHPVVERLVNGAVAAANALAVSNAAKVQKAAVVVPDLSVAGGELTPTLKVKRQVVVAKHKPTIAAFYE